MITQPWDDVVTDVVPVSLLRGGADVRLGVQLEPRFAPCFYFINDQFECAMYAPDKSRRWELKTYVCSEEDIDYAKKSIEPSPVKKGIQRVDACRTKRGELLMELEDLDPYLLLDLLSDEARDKFVADKIAALKALL